MPLFVNGSLISKSKNALKALINDQYLLKNSQKLTKMAPIQFSTQDYLYVAQREFGTCTPNQFQYIGSGSATTCNILILRNRQSGRTSCAHFDGCQNQVGGNSCSLLRMINAFPSHEQETGIDAHLVGGYLDEEEQSLEISVSILSVLLEHSAPFHLETSCVLDHNTDTKKFNKPIVRGVAIETKTGEIMNAQFLDKGPDFVLRGALGFTGGDELNEIFDQEKGLMKIGPGKYQTLDHAAHLLKFGDKKLLECTSTSPLVEDDQFVPEIRNVLKFLVENPDSNKFFNGKTRYWKKLDGKWQKVE